MGIKNYHITLNTGKKMPLIGLGLYKASEEEQQVEKAIIEAAGAGYRLFDTASMYKNEDGVGRGIKGCGVSREELFVTTKIWNTAQRVGDVLGSFERSLERLGLNYLDLYLIHWPVKGCFTDTWKEMEKLYLAGRTKSIGVSNFGIHHLDALMQTTDIVPAVNQIEFHPYFNQMELVEYCQANGITVQAYSPLARGAYMNDPVVLEIAKKYDKSAGQIGLRWAIEHKVAIIPKTVNQHRLIQNADIFDFSLTTEEVARIDALNKKQRVAGIPDDIDPKEL